ncbi:Putative protein C9orf24 like protein [Chelonia mydas]|uniref:Spermatid-specific manchette-related protein 1 n=1 Tax=Chelonia mydas TaxID=8469 RepID=M7AXE7_CHEMY|nr:Putative protein C9orf24 like protein [Chelonia mydas]
MFLFARKTKTPISTYTDSYRAPNSMRKTFQEPPMTLWSENKFVTEGLTVPRVENQVNQAHLEKMIKHAVQEYSYKNTIEPTAYRPEKYWLTRPEEREVVVNMLNSLSRSQLPSVRHESTLPGRKPFQGYYSPCTGRHYCVRGMDYYVDGAPCNERQLNQLVEKIVRNIPYCDCSQETMGYAPLHNPPQSFPYMNLKWDTSHFQKAGGPQKDNYVIHPEFVSESYPTSPCW